MNKLIFVNACTREEESRTLMISKGIIGELSKKYDIKEYNLNSLDLMPLSKADLENRINNCYSPKNVELAREFANADRIVVAAPFWDMGIPAILKTFIECISLSGITFKDSNTGLGGCIASKMLYITTRGLDIKDDDPLEAASPYLKALCWLWDINEFEMISACGLDIISSEEQKSRIEKALKEGLKLIEKF